jgi:hypothetical protein
MNNKFIIQIIIIVGAFVGAGFVLYNGLFKQNGQPAAPISAAAASQQNILPYGSTMDLDGVLYQRNLQYNLVAFPVLDPNAEVGVPENKLITPLVTAPATPAKK